MKFFRRFPIDMKMTQKNSFDKILFSALFPQTDKYPFIYFPFILFNSGKNINAVRCFEDDNLTTPLAEIQNIVTVGEGWK